MFRYGLVGLASFLMFAGISALPVLIPVFPAPVATALGVLAAGLVNFFGHRHFTFAKTRSLSESLPRYCLLVGFNSLLAALIVGVLSGGLSMPVVASNFVGLVAITIVSYVALPRLIV